MLNIFTHKIIIFLQVDAFRERITAEVGIYTLTELSVLHVDSFFVVEKLK